MTIKEQILEIFFENKGEYISGEQLGKRLFVSRNAIWKAVKSLKDEGFCIESSTKMGYKLSEETDILSKYDIEKHTENYFDIEIFNEINSTNTYIKTLTDVPHGKVIIADKQTSGRGRLSRNFHSPEGTGIYMSININPDMRTQDAVFLTTIAAVAVCTAISEVCKKECLIKWVNDIFYNERKVCGILTEGIFDAENGRIKSVIIGIGINVFFPEKSFPEDIENIAGALYSERVSGIRNRLISEILNKFHFYYSDFSLFKEEYKRRSFIIGKHVKVTGQGQPFNAKILDIDNELKLVAELENGEIRKIFGGEVSIRSIHE